MSRRYPQRFPPQEEKKGLSRGAKIAIIVSIVIVVLIIIGIIIWLLLRGNSTSQGNSGDALVCSSNSDCPLDFVCNTNTSTCVECLLNDDCANNVNRKFCDMNSGICAICVLDSHCPAEAPNCSNNQCFECIEDADCGESEVCSAFSGGGSCVECRTSAHCMVGQQCTNNMCVAL